MIMDYCTVAPPSLMERWGGRVLLFLRACLIKYLCFYHFIHLHHLPPDTSSPGLCLQKKCSAHQSAHM